MFSYWDYLADHDHTYASLLHDGVSSFHLPNKPSNNKQGQEASKEDQEELE